MNVLLLMDYDLPDDETSVIKLVRDMSGTSHLFEPETVHLAIRETRAALLAMLESDE